MILCLSSSCLPLVFAGDASCPHARELERFFASVRRETESGRRAPKKANGERESDSIDFASAFFERCVKAPPSRSPSPSPRP